MTQSAIIIFDIGDTLTTTDKVKSFWHMGPLFTIKSLFHYIKSEDAKASPTFGLHIQNFYLDTLDQIPSPYNDVDYQINGLNERKHPPLLRDAMLGKLDCKTILKIGDDWISKNKNTFKNKQERKMFKKIFHLNFEPEVFIDKQKLTPYAHILPKCYNAKDQNGNRKNKCMILSNFAKDWLPDFKQKFNETIFKYIDEQVFSCNEGYAKPAFKIYEKCFEIYKDKLKELWIFIDDQKENREAFEIYCKNNNINGIAVHPKDAEFLLKKHNLI